MNLNKMIKTLPTIIGAILIGCSEPPQEKAPQFNLDVALEEKSKNLLLGFEVGLICNHGSYISSDVDYLNAQLYCFRKSSVNCNRVKPEEKIFSGLKKSLTEFYDKIRIPRPVVQEYKYKYLNEETLNLILKSRYNNFEENFKKLENVVNAIQNINEEEYITHESNYSQIIREAIKPFETYNQIPLEQITSLIQKSIEINTKEKSIIKNNCQKQ